MKNYPRTNSLIFNSLLILLLYIFSACQKNTSVARIQGNQNIQMISNVKYGSNIDWQGDYQDLLLDIYMPATSNPDQKFPMVLFVHGGGFVDGDKAASANM